jgi:hypothetical protein
MSNLPVPVFFVSIGVNADLGRWLLSVIMSPWVTVIAGGKLVAGWAVRSAGGPLLMAGVLLARSASSRADRPHQCVLDGPVRRC